VTRVKDIFLGVKLGIEVSVLLLSIDEEVLLVINLLSQSGDHIDVDLNTRLVVVLHAALFISDTVEVLLQTEELILEKLVFSFSGTKVHGLSSELSN
jgi:hypothetical protein